MNNENSFSKVKLMLLIITIFLLGSSSVLATDELHNPPFTFSFFSFR